MQSALPATTASLPENLDSREAAWQLRVVVLVPAYNEAGSIGATLDGLMVQSRPADRIVVIPNGCSDATAWEARKYPVTVMELPRLEHRKSEALNRAWNEYAYDADVVVCLDADTVLPPNALAAWAQEFAAPETPCRETPGRVVVEIHHAGSRGA